MLALRSFRRCCCPSVRPCIHPLLSATHPAAGYQYAIATTSTTVLTTLKVTELPETCVQQQGGAFAACLSRTTVLDEPRFPPRFPCVSNCRRAA